MLFASPLLVQRDDDPRHGIDGPPIWEWRQREKGDMKGE